jgi:uncharacterized protein (TIGR04255 family)
MSSTETPRLHFKHAPIIEALFRFSIVSGETDRSTQVAQVCERLSDRYEAKVAPTDRDGRPTLREAEMRSNDGLFTVRIDGDGVGCSRLAPYNSWEDFVGEARRVWNIYRDVLQPVEIESFLTRYRNKLVIPIGFPLRRFLNVYPVMPDRDVLFDHVQLFTQTSIANPPGKLIVYLAGPWGTAEEGQVNILLDNGFLFSIRDENAIWRNLDNIRKIKNDTFLGQLTPEMKEMIS